MGLFKKANLKKITEKSNVEKRYSILLVDDEPDNLTTLADALSEEYHVETAESGNLALDLISKASGRFHLIISDQRMPGCTGVDLFVQSRTLCPRAKRIMLSGFADIEEITAAINKAHIHQFLTKPVDTEQLRLCVKRTLETFELEEQHEMLLEEMAKLNKLLEARVVKQKEALHDAMERMESMATTDLLTGVYNRRKFEATLETEISRASRYGHSLSLLMLDIDYFKKVNDQWGHPTGDQVLKDLADLLKENTRSSDTIGRWGGEEFLILAPATPPGDAFRLGENLRQIIAQHRFEPVGELTVSLGVTGYIPGEDNLMALLNRVDAALYSAKNQGRDQTARL
jgi:diguanylate cyclase (GGDEF)-like protein